jgi:hypothetical protein
VVGTRLTVVCDMSRREHITGNTSTTYEPAGDEKIFPLKSGSLSGKGNEKRFVNCCWLTWLCSAKYTNKKTRVKALRNTVSPVVHREYAPIRRRLSCTQVTSRLMANGCGHPTAGREPQTNPGSARNLIVYGTRGRAYSESTINRFNRR